MRYKFNKILTASLFACLILGSFVFNSCKKEDEVSIIKLTAFGPSPALRGGELKFLGTSLDQVTSIVLPEGLEVTEITKTSPTEISILIPQTAKPGLVVLKTPQGDITTTTPLTFSEPIVIESFAPTTVKAGDVLTINGDYLNLIASVTFKTGVVVDSSKFVSKSRKKIEVRIPVEAQTGKIVLSNGAKTPIQVPTLTDLIVTLPTITSLAPNPVKPETALTITGTNFQLVKSISFTGSTAVTDFIVNTDKTTITVTVPKNVKEGTIKLTTLSSVDVESTLPLNLISPVISTVAPMLVKNGATLTITGTNLDLATKVTFGGNVDGVVVSQSATKIDVTVPMTAVDGTVVLSTNSGKTIESAAITLVKPTFTSFAPLSLVAGDNVTINGTDLDLIKKVVFTTGLSVDVTPSSATSFTVTVPMAAVDGKITLVTSNGTEITSTSTLAVVSPNKPVITAITPSVKPGKMMTITGTKLNLVESVYFQNNLKAVLYGVRTETSIEVYVPETAKAGVVTLTLNAFDGTAVVSPTFTVTGTDPVLDPSLMIYSFDAGWSGFTWDGVGGLGTLPDGVDGTNHYYEATPWDASKYWLFANNYLSYPSVTQADHVVKMDVRLRKDVTGNAEIRLMLGGKAVNILSYIKVGDTFTTGGEWKTITIPLSVFGAAGLADPTPVKGGEWGMTMWGNGLDFSGFCIDNIRYEKTTAPAGVYGLY